MTSPRAPRAQIGAREYLTASFGPSDRLAVLLRNPDRREIIQRITTAARISESSFQEWLHFKNSKEGFDVYGGMNPLKPDARTRTKEDILSIRHLYVDLDQDGPRSLAAIGQSNLVPPPNYVFDTSPDKFQVIWKVEGVTQEQAEGLLRVMARGFGGDPAATDSTRVLRMPGFANKKYDQDFMVKAHEHSGRMNHFLDFKLELAPADSLNQPLRRTLTRSDPGESRSLSQSEHDWAFAKRALLRGTEPEQIIRSIAQFREGDKHDSLDYARRTVTKAKAQLEEGRQTSRTATARGGQPPDDRFHD